MLRTLISRTLVRAAIPAGILSALMVTGGCETKSFLDPGVVGRWEKDPLVVPILSSLNIGTDEADSQFATARDVRESDLTETAKDYQISPNDLVSVSITDLIAPGSESTKSIRVSQTGKISLPLLPQSIQAAGLTEQQLERAIADAYKDAQVITNAQVTASVVEARGRTYQVLGAVNAPGLYAIYDTDFRVLDALTTAHGATSVLGIDNIYIIRHKKTGASDAASDTGATTQPAKNGVDPLAPQSNAAPLERKAQMLDTGAPTSAPEGGIVVVDGKEVVVNKPVSATNPADGATTQPADNMAAGNMQAAPGSFAFNSLKEPSDREVIRIPFDKLKAGQLKYNIAVLPGDLLYVPDPQTGEYYIGGQVQAPGAYALTARKITLKQAVIAARGLNEVAWPSRTEIVRRLPGDKEIYVRVNLDKVFSGQEPDMYLKPDDQVNVGTNALMPFLGAIRNGFRMTYGFGFLYDRNYAPNNNNNGTGG
ncbi:MAG: polysaccharide biosynthesis/export family protein [Tepidisphaeraceae bacterium]